MATLNADVSADQEWLPLTEADSLSLPVGYYTIGSENVYVDTGPHPATSLSRAIPQYNGRRARRSVNGVAESHLSGATLTRYYPDSASTGGGAGGVTVTGQGGGSVAVATEVQTPGTVLETSPGVASLGGVVVVQEADPGAIGARNLWLQVVFGDANGDGGYGRLWVRNSTDDGWNAGAPMAFGDATTTFVTSPNDVAELMLADAGTSRLNAANTGVLVLSAGAGSIGLHPEYVQIFGGSQKRVVLGTGGPSLLVGTVDPSAGAGVAAVVGSVYFRDTGEVYWKTDGGDTNWRGLPGNALANFAANGAVQIASAANLDLTLQASGTGNLRLYGTTLQFNDELVGTQAAHVGDGATVDDLRDALIASGLMAAS